MNDSGFLSEPIYNPRTGELIVQPFDGEPDEFESLDVEQLSNGAFVWVWTGLGGQCHQGARHYKRRGDAMRAGREWLTKLKLGQL